MSLSISRQPTSTARHASLAVTTIALTLSKFAVRGGGHIPVLGYNGIGNTGILFSTSNLTTLALSSYKSTVSVGPGNRWGDVFSYLAHRTLSQSEAASVT
jgi:FAD/FMN-containing dehydrogenase